MPDLMFTKSFGHLDPLEQAGRDYLKGIKAGDAIRVHVSKPRNGRFHRKFFALLDFGFHHQELYTNAEHWRRACIIEAGFFDDLVMFDGTIQREAKSIAFARMDEVEFGALYGAVVDVIAAFLGTNNPTLEREVREFMVIGA